MSMSDIADQTERIKLPRTARLVQRGGERQHKYAGYVFVEELNVGTPNQAIKRDVGCSRGSGDLGGTRRTNPMK